MQENVRGSFSLITLKSLSEKGLSETRSEFLTALSIPKNSGIYEIFLFAEISLEQSGESLAMTGFVTSHLMNGVMNSVEVESLCALCKVGLSCGCSVLGFNAHFKILLGGVGDDLAETLREL